MTNMDGNVDDMEKMNSRLSCMQQMKRFDVCSRILQMFHDCILSYVSRLFVPGVVILKY